MGDPTTIPGVGPSIAQDLRGGSIDRCVLYVFRCAVDFASCDDHDPELLKWWSWQDTSVGRARSQPDLEGSP